MIAPLALALVVLAKEPPIEAFAPDGGRVPTVAPRAVDEFSPLLAPERKPDGGVVVVPAPSLSVYTVDLPVEIAATAGSLALLAVVNFLITPTLGIDVECKTPTEGGYCDPADLTSFDRYAVGRSSPGWDTFSDIALATAVLLPVGYLGLESIVLPTKTPWRDFAGDLLIVTEAIAMASAFQLVLKFAFQRPRPDQYTPEGSLTDFDQTLSFPSGHVTLVAVSTTALTTTIFFRHPKSPLRWVALGAGAALTGLTAFARVEGGNHFPSDVLIGSCLGAFSGFVVPYFHRKKLPVMPTGSFNPATRAPTVGIQGTF